ncbi:hypothetical protein [Phenylobacterium sp.]|uniref:hypothetical protein n=1 Tax=Phenylobacterium sp. TaxID=1871053 RepID=UPI002C66ABD7|nr:hypothetical protein [Phenylobacterium sp.]HLZ77137.1 hypothetical protein [Phenylobacterium sp.]
MIAAIKPEKPEPSICFELTPALLTFRRAAGNANRHLNTLLVGLETLKPATPIKPPDLVVSWSKPAVPTEWMETRNFALGATMVAVVDGLDRYMKIASQVPGLTDRALDDALNGRQPGAGRPRPNIFERLEALCDFYRGVVRSEHLAGMRLLISWRNQFVHGQDKKPLGLAERRALANSAAFFQAQHGGVSIVDTLDRYVQREPPTLTDLSTLISAAQRLTKALDEHLLQLQEGEVYALALTSYIIHADPDPTACMERLFRRGGSQAAGRVNAELLEYGGNHDLKRRANAPALTRKRLDAILGMGRNRAAREFGIKR